MKRHKWTDTRMDMVTKQEKENGGLGTVPAQICKKCGVISYYKQIILGSGPCGSGYATHKEVWIESGQLLNKRPVCNP